LTINTGISIIGSSTNKSTLRTTYSSSIYAGRTFTSSNISGIITGSLTISGIISGNYSSSNGMI